VEALVATEGAADLAVGGGLVAQRLERTEVEAAIAAAAVVELTPAPARLQAVGQGRIFAELLPLAWIAGLVEVEQDRDRTDQLHRAAVEPSRAGRWAVRK
jgi:hypothetical protein